MSGLALGVSECERAGPLCEARAKRDNDRCLPLPTIVPYHHHIIAKTLISMSFELHYPNLAPCRVVVHGSGGSTKPPVRLPAACLAAARAEALPAVYDFSLGALSL